MKIGDKIKNKRSGTILQIIKIGNPTLTCKVIAIGDDPPPGIKVGSIQKTSFRLIGITYELLDENKMNKLTKEQTVKVKKFITRLMESKIIKENNTYTMISALREIADDLLLSTELLIDNNYGKMEHKEFKDAWYKSSNEFEKKFRNIIKNLMKAGK